jgi:hypothetical protein
VSADAEHDVPAQVTLSLLESFTFGAVHELRVEQLAGAAAEGDCADHDPEPAELLSV